VKDRQRRSRSRFAKALFVVHKRAVRARGVCIGTVRASGDFWKAERKRRWSDGLGHERNGSSVTQSLRPRKSGLTRARRG
jgi:hypothetical protein